MEYLLRMEEISFEWILIFNFFHYFKSYINEGYEVSESMLFFITVFDCLMNWWS